MPKAYADTTPYAASMVISARPVNLRGSSPAPIPTQAETSIWYGSHGPTPPVSRADANSEVQPRTNPNPGPNTRPARIRTKKTSSTPAVPGESPRSTALIAESTPSTASTRGSRPPSLISASTTTITTGSSARKTNGGPTWAPDDSRTNSGHISIISPPRDDTASTMAERADSGTARFTPSPRRRGA